ncbi:hypothetical protein POTOM_048805 [Populus tomentosa]|uniref:Uncharacterized protein n=1 Tax=Populus tomentosa TaxID=118781 RepID=A0A8X7Y9I8_POPTO|nr:hypothetical protein POTOM_048805 [Populus tomentosa]
MPTVAIRDTSATNRLIKKFVASLPKPTALDALSDLLSLDSTHHPLLYLLTLPVTRHDTSSSLVDGTILLPIIFSGPPSLGVFLMFEMNTEINRELKSLSANKYIES